MKTMDERRISRMSFVWNAIYSGFNALQSAFILFAVSRTKELNEVGIITIGFTLATLFMIIARYGIRYYQATDLEENYCFTDYFYARLLTVAGAMTASFIYIGTFVVMGNYSLYKGIIVAEIVTLKLVDAFEDVYVGRFQQLGRLDVGARIASIRIVASTSVIFIMIFFSRNLTIALLAGIISSAITDIILIYLEKRCSDLSLYSPRFREITGLLLSTLSLCVGMVLHNYIGNAPKFLVDWYLSDSIQAISGFIMMPMFIITVLNSFLMQPTVKSLGEAWNRGDNTEMRKMMIRHAFLIMGLAIIVLLIGLFWGLPLLSWMYQVNLRDYKMEFVFIMVGGVIYTLSSYLIVALTAMRRQRWIVGGCFATIVVYLSLGRVFVRNKELMGASYIYILANIILLGIFLFGMLVDKGGNSKNAGNAYIGGNTVL